MSSTSKPPTLGSDLPGLGIGPGRGAVPPVVLPVDHESMIIESGGQRGIPEDVLAHAVGELRDMIMVDSPVRRRVGSGPAVGA